MRLKINWKCIFIAGIGSLISAVAFSIVSMILATALSILMAKTGCEAKLINSEEDFLNWLSVAVGLSLFLSMFLGGVWITRKIESRFVLHGTLIGIVASILILAFLAFRLWIELTTRHVNAITPFLYLSISLVIIQAIGGMFGGYIGGRRRKKLLSAQASQA